MKYNHVTPLIYHIAPLYISNANGNKLIYFVETMEIVKTINNSNVSLDSVYYLYKIMYKIKDKKKK
jgi:hypothetical protein